MIFPLNLGFGSGLPLRRSLFAEPASESNGLRHLPRPFGCAGDLHSSFPELLMPSALPVSAGFWVSPVAPTSSSVACDTVAQVAPRTIPPALPVIDRRVASILSPSAVPVVKAPGCPFASRPRYRRRSVFRLPRMLILRHRLTFVPSRLGVRAIRLPASRFRIAPSTRFGLHRSTVPKSPWFLRRSMSPIPSAPSRPGTSFLG